MKNDIANGSARFNNWTFRLKTKLKFEIKKSEYLKYASNPKLPITPIVSKRFFDAFD